MSAELDYEETTRWVEGDLRIHYHEAGSGPVLILLHGSGPGVSGWSNFRGNLPAFAEHFRTIVMDMPGFGLTDKPELDRVYPEIAAEGVRTLMDHLDIERAHLLGNSMGGYVSAEFALSAPERVDRLALMGPGGLEVQTLAPRPSEGWKRLSEFLAAPSREAMVAWVDCMVENREVVDDELIDERMDMAMRPGAIDTLKEVFATFAEHPPQRPPWSVAERLACPVLVTWGRDDRMVHFEGGLMPFRRMPSAELHVFSNCGHWVQVEQKTAFERVVIEFLTRS